MPARLQQDASLRPVPWRRMAWVIWRQHRIALGGVAAFLGALAIYVWDVGLQLHHAYAAATTCNSNSPACADLITHFNNMNHVLQGGYVLQIVPALIGAFVGAPLLARELETGTFRYAWTQGFERWRWALAKLVALAVAVTVAAGALSVLLSWYYQPYFATRNGALELSELSPFGGGVFGLRGVAFAAWTLAAFAIGGLAGMLIRRVVPAIVATLAAYTGLALVAANVLRQHYLTPLLTRGLNVPASAWIMRQWWDQSRRLRVPHLAGRPHQPPAGLRFLPNGAAWEAVGGNPRPVLRPARLHATDQLPAGQPVLDVPVDRGRLAARAVGAAHRRDRLGPPPPGSLNRPATAFHHRPVPGRPAARIELSHHVFLSQWAGLGMLCPNPATSLQDRDGRRGHPASTDGLRDRWGTAWLECAAAAALCPGTGVFETVWSPPSRARAL